MLHTGCAKHFPHTAPLSLQTLPESPLVLPGGRVSTASNLLLASTAQVLGLQVRLCALPPYQYFHHGFIEKEIDTQKSYLPRPSSQSVGVKSGTLEPERLLGKLVQE